MSFVCVLVYAWMMQVSMDVVKEDLPCKDAEKKFSGELEEGWKDWGHAVKLFSRWRIYRGNGVGNENDKIVPYHNWDTMPNLRCAGLFLWALGFMAEWELGSQSWKQQVERETRKDEADKLKEVGACEVNGPRGVLG